MYTWLCPCHTQGLVLLSSISAAALRAAEAPDQCRPIAYIGAERGAGKGVSVALSGAQNVWFGEPAEDSLTDQRPLQAGKHVRTSALSSQVGA